MKTKRESRICGYLRERETETDRENRKHVVNDNIESQ